MPDRKVTDEQLHALLRHTNSPSEIARELGMSTRGVVTRLRKLGVPPMRSWKDAIGPPRFITRPEGRIDVELQDGVALVGSDAHYFPGAASTAHRAFLKLIRELQPRIVVLNGDVFDGATVSRHTRIGWEKRPSVIEELRAVDERVTEIQDAAGRARLLWPLGNHDLRFESSLSASAPQFEGVRGFTLREHFPAWSMCWAAWINAPQCPVVVKHRWKGGVHAVRNNALNAGTSFVTGHLHSLKVSVLSDYTGTRFGVDCGTLAEPYGEQFAAYTELSPVDWRSGFVVLTFWRGRLLWPEVVHVIDEGLVEFRGQIIDLDDRSSTDRAARRRTERASQRKAA